MQSLNLVVVTVLVNISAGFSALGIFNKNKSPSFIKFLIKGYFNSMCLHLEWRIGFLARQIALWLSLNNGKSSCSFPNSFIRFFNDIISFTTSEKVEHYIRIKTYKPIVLRFWVESGVNVLCGWAHVSLVLYLPSGTPSIDLTSGIRANG